VKKKSSTATSTPTTKQYKKRHCGNEKLFLKKSDNRLCNQMQLRELAHYTHKNRSLSESDLLKEIDKQLVLAKGFLFARIGMS